MQLGEYLDHLALEGIGVRMADASYFGRRACAPSLLRLLRVEAACKMDSRAQLPPRCVAHVLKVEFLPMLRKRAPEP